MDEPKQEDLFDAGQPDREGAFDAQLSLPLPSVAAPAPFQTVVKRDGRHEPFVKRKIAEAIFKAAQSIGGHDEHLADSLASAVTIYLSKRLQGQAPTVDHIHDAVERVLIQMAHAKTALAYARYRDRRDRIRRLRKGDMRQLLGELEEARIEREAQGGAEDKLLSVRTSGDELVQWDRARIVRALERETQLEPALAQVIAVEVEQQIRRAGMSALTTSLIRELVGAKLVEHGLDEYRDRHRRLGVPLFDAEHIIRGTTPETLRQDPVATDAALARAVKKEYALAEVFSPSVTEAHLGGIFHIHHLDRVDRLLSAHQSIESIVRYGLGLPGSPEFAAPPKHLQTLLAQLVKANRVLQGYYAEPIVWDAANVFLAPFLEGMEAGEVRQFAQAFLYEFAYQALEHGRQGQAAEVRLAWDIPEYLAELEAAGPGARGVYARYAHQAQQFAWALVQTVCDGGVNGATLPAPLITVRVGPQFFHADGHEEFLLHCATAASKGRRIAFSLDRQEGAAQAAWRPRMPILQQITLNLPRAAYENATPGRLEEALHPLVAHAAGAHAEKRAFLEGLLDECGERPLGWLAYPRMGHAPVGLDEAAVGIAVDGLNEAVQLLLGGAQMHQAAEARALGARILSVLERACQEESERRGFRIILAQNNASSVSRRFATLDAKAFPRTAPTVLKTEEASQALEYTMGVRLCRPHGLNPIEAVRFEGELHPFLGAGAQSEVTLPLEQHSPKAISDFLRKAWAQTVNQRLLFA